MNCTDPIVDNSLNLQPLVPQTYEITEKTKQIFSESIIQGSEDAYFPSTLSNLILPTLQNRNILILRPLPRDASRIEDKFSMTNNTNIKEVAQSGGIFIMPSPFEDFTITQLAMTVKIRPDSKVQGAVQYFFKSGKCHIESIVAKPKQKYGSLLLGAAILDAQEKNISLIIVESKKSAFGFYNSFGFIPSKYVQNQSEWQELTEEERDEEVKDMGRLIPMQLDLRTSDKYIEKISEAIFYNK